MIYLPSFLNVFSKVFFPHEYLYQCLICWLNFHSAGIMLPHSAPRKGEPLEVRKKEIPWPLGNSKWHEIKPILCRVTYGLVGHNYQKIIISLKQLTSATSESKSPEALNFCKLALPVATLRQRVIHGEGVGDRSHIFLVMSVDLFTAGIFYFVFKVGCKC